MRPPSPLTAGPKSLRHFSGWLAALLALALTGGAFPARAHDIPFPKADHLRISPSRIRLELRYDLQVGLPSSELRAMYDRDRDGLLSAGEREALRDYLELAATHFLEVRVDGKELSLKRVEGRVAELEVPLPSDRSIQSTFVLEAALPPWPVRDVRRIVLEDRHKDKRYPVSISIAPEGGCRLSGGVVVSPTVPESRRPIPVLRPGEPVLRGVVLRSGERVELALTGPGSP